MDSQISSLPIDVQSLLLQDYAGLSVQFQCGSWFSIEGLRIDSQATELIEITSLNNLEMVTRVRKDFESCAGDPTNPLRAIDSHISGNHYFARFSASGQSLYRKFVHSRPYIGGEEGLDMLKQDLVPLIHRDRAGLLEVLQAGISLCQAVQKLHDRHILHNNINPHVCYWIHGVVLRGRCLTNTLFNNNAEPIEDEGASCGQNLLPYLSPEASGRVDQKPDFRSDIYSVGCTLYELLIGRPPLTATDMLTYIHRHLTMRPEQIHKLSPVLPSEISAVLSKCLEKSADLRYQSIAGLKFDLEALHAMVQDNTLDQFKLGSLDDLLRFEVSKELCGRDKEVAMLQQTWQQVTQSTNSAVVIISGPSGIGKSQLIRTLLEKSDQALFAGSKYHQYRRGLPFQVLFEAMQHLVRQILSQNQRDIRSWRNKLLKRPELVFLIAENVPEIKSLLGELDPKQTAKTVPHEARRRLHAAFVFVLTIFAQNRGLIIFQDDIQWAGPGEMELIAEIALEVPHMLLILARRPTDVDDHISSAIGPIKAANNPVIEMELGNLTEQDVCTLIERTLHKQKSTEMTMLARFIHDRTGGNPFFTSQMLETLHRNNKIYYDIPARRWRFDIKAMSSDSLSLNIIEMITRQMKSLAQPVQSMLITAAALGQESFSSDLLCRALGQTLEETRSQMHLAMDHNILRPSLDLSSLSDLSQKPGQELFGFLHDRTQEAAYALASPQMQAQVHHKIACNIRDQFVSLEDCDEGQMFVLANQFNLCMDILSVQERVVSLDCNLIAGRAALEAGDASSALYYFRVAEYICEKYQQNLITRLRIRFSMIDAQFANNAHEEILELVKLSRPHCESLPDKAKCYIIETKALAALGQIDLAITAGLNGLDTLSIPIPVTDAAAVVFAEKLSKTLHHDVESIAKLAEMPPLSEPFYQQVLDLLSTLILPVYMARPQLLAALCYLSMSITTKYGPSAEGAYLAVMLGAYLSSVGGRDNLQKSYAYGNLALQILQKAPSLSPLAPGMYHMYAGHIAIFHKTVTDVMQYEDLAVSTGKAFFNFEYAVYSLVEKPVFLCWADQNLSQALKDLRLSKEYVIGTKSDSCRCLLAIHMYGVGMLVGEDVDEDLGLSHFLDSADPSHTIETEVSTSHAFMWELWQLIDCILIRDVLRCRKVIYKCCYRYLGGVLGTYYAALAHYLAAIALLTMKFMKVEITLEEEALITKAKAMIEEYAEFAPGTFQCKSAFLDILQHRLTTHDRLEMLDKYDLALEKASAFGNYFDQSMLLESAFRWLRTFSPQRGLSYLRRSYDLYASWNCLKKVLLLETEFPWLTTVPASQSLPRPSIGESAAPTESNTISSYMPTHERFLSTSSHSHDFSMSRRRSSGAFHSHLLDHTPQIASLHGTISGSRNGSATEPNKLSELDIKTVLNASIQISQGIKVEEVLESLMRTVLLAAGADYGILALYTLEDTQAENLMLHMLADTDNLQLMNNIPALSRPDLLPLSVVRTVTATQKSIIRNSSDRDSLFDHSFSRDQYYVRRERQLKSVLCMSIPSTNQGKSRGILYLENNVTTSAFTQARVECLTLLCSQSAMTLERATVYQEMRSAKAQAEEATAQKSTFLANVSHEIRTPFNALLSCAIFLLDTSLTQMQKDYVLMIRDSATLTLSIIDGILDFSKIEQGMMDLVLSQFSITQNIEGALQVVAQKAGQAGVDLVYSREHADDQVIGDAHHLRQVILNLLGNAVKFTSDGCVKVTSATKTRVSDSRQILSVIVKDTGIGISPTGLERLFKAFSQVDASINRSYGGTGLGLAISKKLMELMGGKIWVQSVPGEGTSFHLEFPVDIDPSLSSNSASMEIEQSEELRKQGRLALVVTRFHSTADVLMDDLTRIGLLPDKNTEILDADSIAEAAKLKPYSIIFVDLQVDGALKLVQSLQKILYSAESLYKVVILTNHGSNIPKDMSSKRIVGYLMKPILKAKLRDIVSSALSKIGTAEDENSAGALGGGRDQLSTTEEAGEAQKPKQLRILLAEDNIINTRVALQHLKRLGFLNVAHAKDGIEVLEYCQKASEARNMYDIILMDVQMPRLDGIGATRELLKQYPERSTRPVIIALTANATSTDKEKCLEAGMNGHCSKPILPDQLLQTLSSITRRPSVVMT